MHEARIRSSRKTIKTNQAREGRTCSLHSNRALGCFKTEKRDLVDAGERMIVGADVGHDRLLIRSDGVDHI